MHHFTAIGQFELELQSGNAQFCSNLTNFFASSEFYKWPWKNDRPPLLYPFKLYASFHSHWWIQIWVIVRKRSNWVKVNDFLPPVTLKFYGWPWKTIAHFFYTHSSLMLHIIAIGGFRFELQSGNTHIGSNLMIFAPCVIEISRMTLKNNNRAPLLYPFKLNASFHIHWWI